MPQEFASLLVSVANTLGAHGEQLKSGDWLITGAAARPVPVKVGDVIELDMGVLGAISLTIC